jgi:hypothetical protein
MRTGIARSVVTLGVWRTTSRVYEHPFPVGVGFPEFPCMSLRPKVAANKSNDRGG